MDSPTIVPSNSLITYHPQEEQLLRGVSAIVEQTGILCYAVGGFVRDKLLGRACKDIDIVCVGDHSIIAEKLIQRFDLRTSVHTFKTFGVSQFTYHDMDIEIVTARKESYQPHSRNPSVDVGTMSEDFERRDFTINAMAIQLEAQHFGELLDPFGGRQHLQEKRIITPTDPDQTFSDDPLRILRAIRFACQLDFEIAPHLWESILRQSERMSILTKERITQELNKILASARPSIGLNLIDKANLWAYIIPEVAALKGVEFIDGKGHKDNFYHTLQVVDNVAQRSEDLWLRWAALLHDIAKPQTKKFVPGRGWTFHGHDFIGAKMVKRIFRTLKLPLNEKMDFVAKMVLLHLRPISLTKEEVTDSAMRRLLFDAGEDIEALMLLCESDITSKQEEKVAKYLDNFRHVRTRMDIVCETDKMRHFKLAIDGRELMEMFGLPPCKKIGIIKQRVLDAVLDGIIPNSPEATQAWAKRIVEEEKIVDE